MDTNVGPLTKNYLYFIPKFCQQSISLIAISNISETGFKPLHPNQNNAMIKDIFSANDQIVLMFYCTVVT
jgi:hypothetical protein